MIDFELEPQILSRLADVPRRLGAHDAADLARLRRA